jgi:hypothetical protein
MTRHTVIPDIHADFERLQQSLRHASAGGQVAFLGDFIDAGIQMVPKQLYWKRGLWVNGPLKS